jgi:MFS transporter, DHA1 family, inner membrane transport protein
MEESENGKSHDSPAKADAATRRHERGILLVLGAVQFTSIVDFMLVMPLGPQLMRTLTLTPAHFGLIVSSYTFSAGIAGILAAPLIDRHGRKAAFLTLYFGFLLGTLYCGLAWNYTSLLLARIVTGAFGGILGGLAMAIIGDVFPRERHGAATGALMSAFSIASVVGVPFGLSVGIRYGWQTPFLLLAALGTVVLIYSITVLPPLTGHLANRKKVHPVQEMWTTLTLSNHLRAYALIMAVTISGFAVVPFIAPYMVGNVGVAESRLPLYYIAGGILTLISSPLIGKAADRLGRFQVYLVVATYSALIILAITHLGPAPLWVAILVMGFFMVGMSGRMVAALAMIMSSVEPARRGSFMSVYSSIQHISGGLGAYLSGLIVGQALDKSILRFGLVGWLSAGATIASIFLASRLRVAAHPLPMTVGTSLGAADQSMGDPADPLPTIESL